MQVLSLQEYAQLEKPALQFEQQPGWLELLKKHCWPDRRVRVCADQRDGMQTFMPLLYSESRYLGLPLRTLEGLTGLYSSHYLPYAAEASQLQSLFEMILNSRDWDVLRFSAVDAGGDLHRALSAVAEKKYQLICRPDFEHWNLKIDKLDFDAYYAQLPGALRSTLKRKGVKLEKQFQVRFELYREPIEVRAAVEDYKTIYERSWKNAELYPEFVPQLCLWAAENGWLRLGIMYLDDQPVAAQIWIILNGRASIFKLAYDQHYRNFSVGSLLTARMMQHAINDERVTEIEYGKGGETYKRDWMSSCTQRVQLECYNPISLAGRAMSLRHNHLPALKYWLLKSTRKER